MILYQRASAQPLIAVAKSLDFLAGGNRQSSEQTQFAAPVNDGFVRLSAPDDPDATSAHPDRRAPYAQEVIALRIDGSGDVRRIARTRSTQLD